MAKAVEGRVRFTSLDSLTFPGFRLKFRLSRRESRAPTGMAPALLNPAGMIAVRRFASLAALVFLALFRPDAVAERTVIVSVPDQRLVVLDHGLRVGSYPVSTSKFGLGDRPRSYATPLGTLQVASKTGAGAPIGAVFKGKRPTGEILRPNSRGRDPIVTRILHLRGLDRGNSRAYGRGIYIHGTAEERKIGQPASYGCIRMKSKDVIQVFDQVPVGTKVEIMNVSMHRALREVAMN
jgi:lipoprotein-anchoring transpeptidase ErfK/SrfK